MWFNSGMKWREESFGDYVKVIERDYPGVRVDLSGVVYGSQRIVVPLMGEDSRRIRALKVPNHRVSWVDLNGETDFHRDRALLDWVGMRFGTFVPDSRVYQMDSEVFSVAEWVDGRWLHMEHLAESSVGAEFTALCRINRQALAREGRFMDLVGAGRLVRRQMEGSGFVVGVVHGVTEIVGATIRGVEESENVLLRQENLGYPRRLSLVDEHVFCIGEGSFRDRVVALVTVPWLLMVQERFRWE